MLLFPANNAGVSSYLAAMTPGNFQGRMNSAAGFISNVASPVAPVVAGVLIGSVSGRDATLFGAVLVALSTVPLLASPVVRSLGPPDKWSPVTSESQ
jgi:MFS family permease